MILTSAEQLWQLPKGLIDAGESAEQAALREVREEAGIECRIAALIDTIEYSFYADYDGLGSLYHKTVTFFLMTYLSGDVADHDSEVSRAEWVDIETACERLDFENERAVARKAIQMLGEFSRNGNL